MPQYYAILDNGQSKPKGAGMPRKNQNKNRQGGKKVNYRMREGSNYYGDVTAGKKQASYSKAEDARFAGKGRGRNNKAEDSRLAGKKPKAKTSGRTADSRGGRGGSMRAEDVRNARKAPSKNYRKGLYR
jgi:hypothetical protein